MDHRSYPTDTGERSRFTASFVWLCTGYYRHAEGYTPQWREWTIFGGRLSIHRPGQKTWTIETKKFW